MPGAGDEDPSRPGRPGVLPRHLRKGDDPSAYRAFTAECDEIVEADELCDARRADAAARAARPAARASAKRDRAARQPPAAPPDGEADARLGVRSRGGHARYRRGSRASSPIPVYPLSYKREKETEFRDTVVTLLIDNSGSMRGPADHRRGDERRHPRAHARALRRQGRDPGLHHARLEGRPVARALDRRRQAAQSRPAQRSAPHHLQGGRRAVAARAAQASA